MAKNLPSVTTRLAPDLQQFVQRVREALDGGGPDGVVTARQLIVAGIASATSAGGFLTPVATVQAPTPPANLSASGALANIIVSWDSPTYTGHAYTEIWAHTADALGAALLVGMTSGNNFAHNLGQAATRYYWVRNVNRNGLASAYNSTAGLQAATGTDPALLLSLLTDQIAASHLTSALSTRIDLVDGASGVSGSVDARILTETNNRTTADTAIASSVTTLSSTVGGNTSAIQTTSSSVDGLKSQYTVKIDNNGHVSGFGLASNSRNNPLIQSEFLVAANRFAIVDATKPWWDVLDIGGLSNNSGYVEISQAHYNAYTFAGGDFLIIEGHNDASGSNGKFQVDGKGYNAAHGYHILIRRTGTNAGNYRPVGVSSSSSVECRALLSTAVTVPFAVQASATTVNGEAVPAGTYIADAFIKNGTITNAKIGDAAIDNAKIANLDAVKITAGTLNADRIGANSIVADKINTNGLSIRDTSGNIILAAGSPLAVGNVSGLGAFATLAQVTSSNASTYIANGAIQTAQIANAAIDNAKIGNVIQSANYSSGSAGWKIDKTGQMEMNNATFRGTLNVASSASSSTSRLEITGTTIKVFEGSTLRVKIGNLA